MQQLLITVAVSLFSCACTSQCAKTTHSVPAVSECTAAGDRLRELGCSQAATPAGTPFEVACKQALTDGRNWRADCISRVTSCNQVEQAYRTPPMEACK